MGEDNSIVKKLKEDDMFKINSHLRERFSSFVNTKRERDKQK